MPNWLDKKNLEYYDKTYKWKLFIYGLYSLTIEGQIAKAKRRIIMLQIVLS
jgi:hypothetical protein